MIEERGIIIRVPEGVELCKLDDSKLYRERFSSLGLGAVDYVLFSNILVLLEIKNFNVNLAEIESEEALKRKKRELLKSFSKERLVTSLSNKLVSSLYIVFGEKLGEIRRVVYCVLIMLPDKLKPYLLFIKDALSSLAVKNGVLKTEILVVDDVRLCEKLIKRFLGEDNCERF